MTTTENHTPTIASSKPVPIILEDVVTYIKENIPNTEMVDLGEGLHFIQEDHPEAIGAWHAKL